MKVTVTYSAHARVIAGCERESWELPEGAALATLFAQIRQRGGEVARFLFASGQDLQPTIIPFVDDQQMRRPHQQPLHDGCVVSFMVPISGG